MAGTQPSPKKKPTKPRKPAKRPEILSKPHNIAKDQKWPPILLIEPNCTLISSDFPGPSVHFPESLTELQPHDYPLLDPEEGFDAD